MKDYVEANDKKCCEVDNCTCVKHKKWQKVLYGLRKRSPNQKG